MPATLDRIDNVAELIHQLGDIPPKRILMRPRPGEATEEDQLRCIDREPKRLVELIDGVLVEKAMGARESYTGSTLHFLLCSFVRPRNLGIVSMPDGIFRVSVTRNRLPDITFTAWENLPDDHAHLQAVADYPPDLAIEILSEGNTPKEMVEKRKDYFAAGCSLYWEVDPDARTIAAFTSPKKSKVYKDSDVLPGDPVLQGFSLPLKDLFDDPQSLPRPSAE